MKTFGYYVELHPHSELLHFFDSDREEWDGCHLAIDAAEHFWKRHEGWDECWPITFKITTTDKEKKIIGWYKVDIEYMNNTFGFNAEEVS